jgi:hypothetical protein
MPASCPHSVHFPLSGSHRISISLKTREKNASEKSDEPFLSVYALCMKSGLETFEIPYLDGKVCYLDDTGKIPTVECYSRNVAFRFPAPKLFPIKIGEWVRFRGTVNTGIKVLKDGKIKGVSPYIHSPGDGSPKEHWLFFFLNVIDVKRIGPLDVIDALRDCSNICRRFIDSWEANDNVEQLRVLVKSLRHAHNIVEPVLRQKVIDDEEKQAPVKAIDMGSLLSDW